jgi:hypothetical protein
MGHVYMEVFSMQPRAWTFISVFILLLGWAKMKFFSRYTNNETCSLTSYAYIMRERMYATVYVAGTLRIFRKFVRTYGTCMHHDNLFIHIFALFLPL